MQIAATEGIEASPGLGRIAFAQRAATLPGVSEPSSVVRSMQRIARSSAHSLEDFLIERWAKEAARSLAPTSSTLRTPRISEPRWDSDSAVATDGDYAPGRTKDRLSRESLVLLACQRAVRLPPWELLSDDRIHSVDELLDGVLAHWRRQRAHGARRHKNTVVD